MTDSPKWVDEIVAATERYVEELGFPRLTHPIRRDVRTAHYPGPRMTAIIHTDPPIYCGPTNTHNRYMAGEVVTQTDLLHDMSPWAVKTMTKRDSDRLRWMLQNLETTQETA